LTEKKPDDHINKKGEEGEEKKESGTVAPNFKSKKDCSYEGLAKRKDGRNELCREQKEQSMFVFEEKGTRRREERIKGAKMESACEGDEKSPNEEVSFPKGGKGAKTEDKEYLQRSS